MPAVVIGRHRCGIHLPRILPSFEQDAFRLTQALIELGHRRIGLFLNDQTLVGEPQRLHGYQRALATHGIVYDPALVHIPAQPEVYPAYETVKSLIVRAAPTVVMTGPYTEVCAFVTEMGCPVVVATLDEESHIPRASCLIAGLMTAKFEAGVQAVQFLIGCIQDKIEIPHETVLESHLGIYGATGASAA